MYNHRFRFLCVLNSGNLFSSTKIQYEDIPSPDRENKEEVCTNNKIKMAPWCCNICERFYINDISNTR